MPRPTIASAAADVLREARAMTSEALLDDMEWQRRQAGPGGASMDPDRVRGLLGLAPRGAGR